MAAEVAPLCQAYQADPRPLQVITFYSAYASKDLDLDLDGPPLIDVGSDTSYDPESDLLTLSLDEAGSVSELAGSWR